MAIPLDLKSGDKLWFSDTQFAIALVPSYRTRLYEKDLAGILTIWANYNGKVMRYTCHDGTEYRDDTYPIIKVTRQKPKRDKDVEFLLRVAREIDEAAATYEGATKASYNRDANTLRKIAKRLQ